MLRPLIILIVLVVTAPAVPAGAETITLERALEMASGESPLARAAQDESGAATAQARAVTAFGLPHLSLSGGYHRTGTTAVDTPFITYPDEQYMADLTASQVLWSGGRVTRSRRLKGELYESAALGARAAKRDLRLRVRLAYNEVLYYRALIGVHEARVAQRAEELQDALDLKAAGMVTSLDARQAELTLNMAKDGLREAQAAAEVSLIDFNLSLGRPGGLGRPAPVGPVAPVDSEASVVSVISEDSVGPEASGGPVGPTALLVPEGELERTRDLGELLLRARQSYASGELLDLRSARSGFKAREHERAMAAAGHFPTLSLVGTAKTERNMFTQQMDESYSAGLVLTWDVLDGGLVRAEAREARFKLSAAGENLKELSNELSARIRALTAEADAASARIELNLRAVQLARSNYGDARGHYRAGTITQTRLGEFNLALAEARFGLLGLYYLEQQLKARTLGMLEGF